jgi:hypothetical protein
MQKGVGYLLAAQRADGGWPMTSRPLPPGTEGSKNLQPIEYAGAAWGVLGLLAAGGQK